LIGTLAARELPTQVEAYYSRGLYPRIGDVLNGLSERWASAVGAPFGDLSVRRTSLSEVMVGVLLGIVLVLLWRALRRGFGAFVRRLVFLAGITYLVFFGVWGLNHARVSLGASLGLDARPVTAIELNDVALELERDLSVLLRRAPFELPSGMESSASSSGSSVSSGSSGSSGLPGSSGRSGANETLGARAAGAWREAIARERLLGWQPAAITCAPAFSGALAAASITGIFSPFTQEAHVVFGMPGVDLAFTALHEIAHVQGWAREDEANYLAWRVGSRSTDHGLKVAAYALALIHVHKALRRADPILQHKRALELDVRILALIEERAAYWDRTRSQVASRAVGAINDTYLKSQGHRAGVASYGRMVDLLVAELR
jgi:hypothetical protein